MGELAQEIARAAPDVEDPHRRRCAGEGDVGGPFGDAVMPLAEASTLVASRSLVECLDITITSHGQSCHSGASWPLAHPGDVEGLVGAVPTTNHTCSFCSTRSPEASTCLFRGELPPNRPCAWGSGLVGCRVGAGRAGVGSGARLGVDGAGVDWLVADGAHEDGAGELATGAVAQQQGRSLGAGEVPVAPLHERHDRRIQVAPGVAEQVLEAIGVGAILPAVQDAVCDEGLQLTAEDRAGKAEIAGHLAEPSNAVKGLTQDQERPAIADQLHRPCDRIVLEAMIQHPWYRINTIPGLRPKSGDHEAGHAARARL